MNLTVDKTGKLFKLFLVPSLTSAAALSIFGLVDMFAIGQWVGADGVAAFSIATPLFGVTSFLGVFIGIGGSVPMAIAKGEGNEEKYRVFFTLSFLLICALTILLWLVFFLFSTEIYTFFGANDRLMPYVKGYGNWIIGCFPFFFFSIYLACVIRCDGAPSLAMFAVILSGAFNVLGDWLLVYVFDMGIAGAAIATVLCNAIQVFIFIEYFLTARCRLKFVKPRYWLRPLKIILSSGFSTGFIDIAYILLTVLLNNLVLKYGNETHLAVFGVAFTCSSMFQRLFCGVGQAVQPIISANYGAQKPDRIAHTLKLSVLTETVMSIAFALTGILFPIQLVKLFVETTPELLAVTPSIIQPFFLSLFVMGINMFATYYFQSITKSTLATIIALLRGLLLSGLLVILLPAWMGLKGIWWGMVIAEVLVAVFTIFCLKRSSAAMRSGKAAASA